MLSNDGRSQARFCLRRLQSRSVCVVWRQTAHPAPTPMVHALLVTKPTLGQDTPALDALPGTCACDVL